MNTTEAPRVIIRKGATEDVSVVEFDGNWIGTIQRVESPTGRIGQSYSWTAKVYRRTIAARCGRRQDAAQSLVDNYRATIARNGRW